MKTTTLSKNISLLAASLVALMMASSCSQPSERPSKMNKEIDGKTVEISSLKEIVGDAKSVYVSGGEKAKVKELDGSLKQIKLDGTKADEILKKLGKESSKEALAEQLKEGAVAFVILADQVKILKVTNDLDIAADYDVLSSKLVAAMKDRDKATDAAQQSAAAKAMADNTHVAPRALGEKFGMVELAAIKIEKMGVLENEKTDYNERKSVINLSPRPLAMSTHIILGCEIGDADCEKKAEEAKATAAKASAKSK